MNYANNNLLQTILREQKKNLKVSEKTFTIDELAQAVDENRVIEAFGCGTGAIVSPVKAIFYKGKEYEIPINEKFNAGDLTYELNKELTDIQVLLLMSFSFN